MQLLQRTLLGGFLRHFLYGNLFLQHDFVTLRLCISVSFLTQSRFSMFRCTLCALSDAAFFFLWLSLHCTRSFAAPSATKNSADGFSEPICAVPPYSLILQLFALTEPSITHNATSPAKKDIAQRIAEQSKKAGPLAKPCLLLFCSPSFMYHLSI